MKEREHISIEIMRIHKFGIAIIVFLILSVASFSVFTTISGAVIATGQMVVEGKTRYVQHESGGVVAGIFVKDGDLVEKDQLLIRLDDTETRAQLNQLKIKFDQSRIRLARLLTELRDGVEIDFPNDIVERLQSPDTASSVATEIGLFESRRASNIELKKQFSERIEQTRQLISGLDAQLNSKSKEVELLSLEQRSLEGLFEKHLVSQDRFLSIQRAAVNAAGEQERIRTEITRAHSSITEMKTRLLQMEQDFRSQVGDALRTTQAEVPEIIERIAAAEHRLSQIEIRAPLRGYVHELAVNTIRGVISPASRLLSIVPAGERFVIDARVNPVDIDQVSVGATAMVRIRVGNQRLREPIEGIVNVIAAETTKDERTGISFYNIRVDLPEDVESKMKLNISSGMPADVFVQTAPRSPLLYLLEPLIEQIQYAWRER